MIEESYAKSARWRCRHLYPVLIVVGTEGERRARCLGCGMLGPSSSDVATALRALRESAAKLEGA
jgi:hypothetical protein